MKSLIKEMALWLIGGIIYYAAEMVFRGRSHWTMIVVGGICFLICGGLNEWFSFKMPLLLQGGVCACLVTIVEFFAGCVLNLWLQMNIWDYSNMPLNLYGQICFPFTILWVFVCMIGVVVDDYLRYWLFDEEKPHYKIL